jgi:glutathione synthase
VQFLFVMDPVDKLLFDKDTSFAFMRGADDRGHRVLHCQPLDVYNRGGDVFAVARPVSLRKNPDGLQLGDPAVFDISQLEAVFIRKDPPFDSDYAHLTHQLDLVKQRTLVVNDPQGLRDANEKLFAFHFAEFMPPSLVSARQADLLGFLRDEAGGSAVLKPLDGAGGSGVVALNVNDRNTRALIDLLTREGRQLALIQRYMPEIRTGDKRVLVLDGEPLGAILRVPREDDIRANIHVGGTVQATTLTPGELALVQAMGPKLQQHGLWFVGLDLIGERLIEVNVTSPTGIQELGRHLGSYPEHQVIRWVERRVAGGR